MNAIEFLHCSSRFAPVHRLQTGTQRGVHRDSVNEALYLFPPHTTNTPTTPAHNKINSKNNNCSQTVLCLECTAASKPGQTGQGACLAGATRSCVQARPSHGPRRAEKASTWVVRGLGSCITLQLYSLAVFYA